MFQLAMELSIPLTMALKEIAGTHAVAGQTAAGFAAVESVAESAVQSAAVGIAVVVGTDPLPEIPA